MPESARTSVPATVGSPSSTHAPTGGLAGVEGVFTVALAAALLEVAIFVVVVADEDDVTGAASDPEASVFEQPSHAVSVTAQATTKNVLMPRGYHFVHAHSYARSRGDRMKGMTSEIAVSLDGHIYRCYQSGSVRERLETCRFVVRGLGTVTLARKDGRVLFVQPSDDDVTDLLRAIADRLYDCWRVMLS